MKMLETLDNIMERDDNRGSCIKGHIFTLKEDCANDYHKERLAVIPKGSKIRADFAGDFGIYAMVELGGVLEKIKIELHELHKIDFGGFDARNETKEENNA